MLTLEIARTLTGRNISFDYNGRSRQVEVEKVNECANGSVVIVGIDTERMSQPNSQRKDCYRSFNINQMTDCVVS